ncbi:hypothetical protein SBRCBS47491_002225 [Sporothrix bragantina]|uniref:C2H2-type domain-containing protein n=1 Tax=Sporothrix bragantina TaxID=671064 RepID=A0ABP0B502_9PEZI
MSFLSSGSLAIEPGQDSFHGDVTLQPPPLKRSRTSQSSRHTHTALASVGMMPSTSTPYSSAINIALPPNMATPRLYVPSQTQSVLPFRPVQNRLPDVNEMGLDDVAVEPDQFLRDRGVYDATSLFDATAIGYTIPSTCGSLTEATTFDAAMSVRLSDGFNDNSSLPANMVHVDSQRSYQTGYGAPAESPLTPAYTYGAGFETSQLGACFASDEAVRGTGSKYLTINNNDHGQQSPSVPSHLHSGAQPMLRTSSVNTYSSFGGSNSAFDGNAFAFPDNAASCLDALVDMERSMSTSSARSNISLQVRAKNSLRQQNSNATKTQLLPKMDPVTNTDANTESLRTSGSSSGKMQGSVAVVGNNGDGKVKIAKTKRERPKSKKLFCDSCSDCPQGFRGEHELQRHRSRKHSTESKRWVCCYPHENGQDASVDALRPLTGCKHCEEGKTYNAYYNAAAHLRRAHFKEKPSRKVPGSIKDNDGKSGQNDSDATKDWPDMSELKKWMRPVTVTGGQTSSTADVTDEIDAEDDDDEAVFDQDVMVSEIPKKFAASADPGLVPSNGHDDVFFGMGQGFGDAGMASGVSMTRGDAIGRGMAVYAAEYQAEMPRLDGPQQPTYAQDGLISSAHFLESQMNPGNLPLDFSGLVPSGLVSSPSGTTITQGTAHPFHVDSHLEAYAQSFVTDSLDFEFLPPGL